MAGLEDVDAALGDLHNVGDPPERGALPLVVWHPPIETAVTGSGPKSAKCRTGAHVLRGGMMPAWPSPRVS